MEIATLIAAVVGGVTGLVNTVAIILVNGKIDRLTGRVDLLQDAVMRVGVSLRLAPDDLTRPRVGATGR